MNRIYAAVAVILMSGTLIGCTTATEPIEPKAEAETEEPVEQEEVIEMVSPEETCVTLWGEPPALDGLATDVQDLISRFIAAPDLSTIDRSEIEYLVDSLGTAAQSAEDSLRPDIETVSLPLEQLLDVLDGGSDTSIGLADYQSSMTALMFSCTSAG